MPDQLVGRTVRLDGSVAADVADAEAAIVRFDTQAATLVDTEALARLLLRAESVASSRIEGLEVGGRRLLHAEAASALGQPVADVTAAEVLANIAAMRWALGAVGPGEAITVGALLETHRRLLQGSRLAEHAGRLRDQQNWIGGSSYHPCSASFVPPPEELVADLLADLCAFCNTDELSPVVQAALAHAQFETVHPFVDGNGRVGRALIQLVLRRRGLATRVIPPVSLVLATWSSDYIGGLTAARYIGTPASAAAIDGLNQWVGLFATACRRAIQDAERFEAQIVAVQEHWRERIGRVRANSAVDLLIRTLPGAPIVTVNGAAQLIGRTFQATNEGVKRLVDADVLRPVYVGRRNRAFEAAEIIATFTDFERRLASPISDTRAAPPTRRVPRRQGAERR